MNGVLKSIVKKSPLYPALISLRQRRELAEWERNGRPAPPPHLVKQRAIREVADRFGLRVLVETGTYYGDMVEAMRRRFDRILSIELSRELYEKARRRFAGDARIEIVHGDSGAVLGRLVPTLDRPALFWLDGHYSAGETARGEKDTPIFEELTHVFASPIRGHAIIVDDARCFGTDPAYPSLEQLGAFVRSKDPGATLDVVHDGIRIVPGHTAR